MKFAAIDVGSNAVRLLFKQVFEYETGPVFKKDAIFRVPIRLGDDAFRDLEISPQRVEALLEVMRAFRHLISAYQPLDYMACATSAMREAKNSAEIVEEIRRETGISLEIVDGRREAEIIYSTHIAETLDRGRSYLYIDVGGGSTEVVLISGDDVITSHSFQLGTVRLLENGVPKSGWNSMQRWLKEHTRCYHPLVGIGSGGNINKILRLSQKRQGRFLSYKKLRKIYEHLKSLSFEERIRTLRLKPDRAEVIVPASKIFLSVMKWAGIKKMYVPGIGLPDGIIQLLYERHRDREMDESSGRLRHDRDETIHIA
jgi:exopolyphosphatase/guanosine-5'-triphosphate,3'-diphosphate pyrophosphatase